ncbi:DUF3604 domain containing protein [Lysobacter dokdonensis DS-58]|uniref:DUF3604 domain containing protein n=1 Tax=Lysobacter dokdonensis DS-58 TaxID=1300345 RepID=A0A0A2X3D9_9GAMM|nr:DUF3592 domain-containing protein [Lysobacter dokdonensis]KGQ19719.1 DUF3604 domain containing protein [Lysobacter dokdonensis DS-58]
MPLIILGLLALAAREVWHLRLGFASLHWMHTTGTLQHIWQESDIGPADSDGRHSVYAHYTYSVDGRAYEGRRLSYRPMALVPFAEAMDLLYGLRKGSEIDVYYDPARPERAVMIPGTGTGNIVGLATLLVLAVLCAWAWVARF